MARGVFWTAPRILNAIRDHAAAHGAPPRYEDAVGSAALPHPLTAARVFGSWPEAIAAAGYTAPRRGRPRKVAA